MAERRPTALVAGGGVVGLTCAVALAERFSVTVVDPGGPNASTVAAGMLAPAAEAALDADAPPFALMNEALDLWPAFAQGVGASEALHPCGTLWVGDDPGGVAARVRQAGGSADVADPAAARGLQPSLTAKVSAVAVLPGDQRVDVAAVTAALQRTLRDRGARSLVGRVVEARTDGVTLGDGERRGSDVVVVAAGWNSEILAGSIPELAGLTPVRGQLLRFQPGVAPSRGAMLRHEGGYLVPSVEGPVAGASMEAGATALQLDAATLARFAADAGGLCAGLGEAVGVGDVGVRAATPDGAPLVGRSVAGPLLATGFRRNGWLLAPFAARLIAAAATGADPGAWAETLAPGRFLSPARNGSGC